MAAGPGVEAGRMVDTMLRVNGGFPVLLRMPGMAASGDDSEQLGLATAAFQDQPLGPGIWRKAGVDTALLVSAGAVATMVGSGGFRSANALFAAAAGAVVNGVVYAVASCEPVVAGGRVCGYRLGVVEPVGG